MLIFKKSILKYKNSQDTKLWEGVLPIVKHIHMYPLFEDIFSPIKKKAFHLPSKFRSSPFQNHGPMPTVCVFSVHALVCVCVFMCIYLVSDFGRFFIWNAGDVVLYAEYYMIIVLVSAVSTVDSLGTALCGECECFPYPPGLLASDYNAMFSLNTQWECRTIQ